MKKIKKITFLRFTPFINVSKAHPQEKIPSFHILYSATMLIKKAFEVNIIDLYSKKIFEESLIDRIFKTKYDLLIVEIYIGSLHQSLQILKKIKQKKKNLIIVIGSSASSLPDILLGQNSPIDACIMGESEATLEELICAYNNNRNVVKVDGLAVKIKNKIIKTKERKLINNLDQLPFINYELIRNKGYAVKSLYVPVFGKLRRGFLLTSRGCKYNCIYCSPELRRSFGKNYRSQSPERVVAELEYLVKQEKCNAVFFADDIFNYDLNRVRKICKLIISRKLKIKWIAQVRIDRLPMELLVLMKKAGCRGLTMSAESGNNRILKLMKKGLTREITENTVKNISKVGINITLYFMIGNPGETKNEIMETIKWARKLRPMMIQVAFFTAYPGSTAYNTYNVSSDTLINLSHYNNIMHNFSTVSSQELVRLQRKFYLKHFISLNFFYKYLVYRLPYIFFNFREEFSLIWQSILFFIRKIKF